MSTLCATSSPGFPLHATGMWSPACIENRFWSSADTAHWVDATKNLRPGCCSLNLSSGGDHEVALTQEILGMSYERLETFN